MRPVCESFTCTEYTHELFWVASKSPRFRGHFFGVFCLAQGAGLKFMKCLYLCALLSAASALATTVAPQSLPELSRRSNLVVHGRIVQIEVDASSGRRTAVLEPLEIVKGDAIWKTEREFYIPLHNRAIPRGNLIEVVPAAPDLRYGEEVVAFLQPLDRARQGAFARRDGRPVFVLEGLQQGRWRVIRDAGGVRRVLAWDEGFERASTPAQLRQEKTTPRTRLGKLVTPQDKRDEISQSRTLDSLLNLVRGNAR